MKVKDILFEKLLSGEVVSGAELASDLGVSRNAVWKAINELKESGYIIQSDAVGYKLIGGDVINRTVIKRYLTEDINVEILEETSSTNDIARALAEQGRTAIVVAQSQGSGRGRFRRPFFSPKGMGVYMSVILRPRLALDQSSKITAYAAVVVAQTVQEMSGAKTGIKWVNDIYIGKKKICGILTEAAINVETQTLDYAVVGIGVNVGKCEFPPEIADVATSVEAETGIKIDRNELIARITNRLQNAEKEVKSGEFMHIYRTMSNIIGAKVLVNSDYEADVLDISMEGELIVQAEGETIKLTGGEVSLKLL